MAIDFSRGSFIPQDFNFSGLGAGAGAAGAQAAANVGNIKAALNNSEYDKIAARAVANDAQKEAAKWGLEAQFQIGGLEALSSVLGNQHMVEAYKENEKTIADAWVEAEAIKRKGSGGGDGGDDGGDDGGGDDGGGDGGDDDDGDDDDDDDDDDGGGGDDAGGDDDGDVDST